MQRSLCRSRAQLVLDLENHNRQTPANLLADGLVEALAELLLEALSEEPTKKGGEDEHQDHA